MVPSPQALGQMLGALDMIGIAVFAASGALAATRAAQTFVTAAFFALVTGVGGGTLRDLLIGAPVFWVHGSPMAAICVAMAGLVWVTPEHWWRERTLEWLDAAGLAAYAVFGAAKALSFGVPPFQAGMMGVLTACVGGIVRDVLAGVPSILMRPELYVTAAALSAGLHVVLVRCGLPPFVAALPAAAAGFALRGAAIQLRIALPAYRGKR